MNPIGTLSARNVTKTYGAVTAVADVDLTVQPGEIAGFVGANGAGKSTTMRIIVGLVAPTAGEVYVGDHPITEAERRAIGYMPEERGLYPKMKIGDQLIYLAKLHGMGQAAATTAMEYWTDRLGIAERRKNQVQELSLGNQQRVQLAAALIHDPAMLILDEPFSGLDPLAVEVMGKIIQEKSAAGIPVLFSSHQLDLVERLCHRVNIISGGRIQAAGSVAELRSGGPRRFDLFVALADGTPAEWLPTTPGVTEVLRTPDGGYQLYLTAAADEQALLRDAQGAGNIVTFAPYRAHLSELYREVVQP